MISLCSDIVLSVRLFDLEDGLLMSFDLPKSLMMFQLTILPYIGSCWVFTFGNDWRRQGLFRHIHVTVKVLSSGVMSSLRWQYNHDDLVSINLCISYPPLGCHTSSQQRIIGAVHELENCSGLNKIGTKQSE